MIQTEYEMLETFTDSGYLNTGAVDHEVCLLTLSNCKYCDEAKQFLEGLEITYRSLEIDTASKEERRDALIFLGERLPAKGVELAFPIIIIGRETIMGFEEEKIRMTLKSINAF
jgi:glutaredoxin